MLDVVKYAVAGCSALYVAYQVRNNVRKNSVFAASSDEADSTPLRLRNVQIFVRHGARTPLRVLPYLDQATWSLDELLADPIDLGRFPYVVRDLRGRPLEMGLFESLSRNITFKGGAAAGQLTMPGKRQMYQLGLDLRNEYVDGKHFLEPTYNENDVYIRSTNITRTMESAVWLVSGLYRAQPTDSTRQMPPVNVYATTEQDEILYPNHTFCTALNRLTQRMAQHNHEISGFLDDRDALEKALSYNIETHKRRLDFVDLRDEVAARQAHSLHVNPVLVEWYDRIDNYAVKILTRMVAGNDPTKDIRNELLRLACGPALHMVSENMYAVVQNRNRFKLEIYSCHDSMMISLLMALDIFDGAWPPYAADLRFELLESEQGSFFVRVMYLGKNQALPVTVDKTQMESKAYPLEQFERLLSNLVVNQRHLQDLCEQKKSYTEPLEGLGEAEGSYFVAGKEAK